MSQNLHADFSWMSSVVWGVFLLFLIIELVRLWAAHRRISNTEYRIYSNKIEASSYLFRFMGAHNNVVSLAHLRQIQACTNSLLDLWFFHCGSVTLTVSGDVPDFRLENIYQPGTVRQQIEAVAFGEATDNGGAGHQPEVSE
jgi:hypothetical protein